MSIAIHYSTTTPVSRDTAERLIAEACELPPLSWYEPIQLQVKGEYPAVSPRHRTRQGDAARGFRRTRVLSAVLFAPSFEISGGAMRAGAIAWLEGFGLALSRHQKYPRKPQ